MYKTSVKTTPYFPGFKLCIKTIICESVKEHNKFKNPKST